LKKIFLFLFTVFSIISLIGQSDTNMMSVQVKLNTEMDSDIQHFRLKTTFTNANKSSITFYSCFAEFRSEDDTIVWTIPWPYEYPSSIYIDNFSKNYLLVTGNIIRELSESGKIGMTYFTSFDNLNRVSIKKFMTDADKIGFQFYSSLNSGGGDPGIIIKNGTISWKRGIPNEAELCVYPEAGTTKTNESDYEIPEGVLIKKGLIPFISTPAVELSQTNQYEYINIFQTWGKEFHWKTKASPNDYWNSINTYSTSSETRSSKIQTSTPFDYDKPIQVSINGIFKNKVQIDWILPDKTKGFAVLDISDCPIANELIVPKVVLKHPDLPYNSNPFPGEFAYIYYIPKDHYNNSWQAPKFFLEWRNDNLCLVLYMLNRDEQVILNYWSKRIILFSSKKQLSTSQKNYDVWNAEISFYSNNNEFTLSKNQNINNVIEFANERFLSINSDESILCTLKNEKELLIRNVSIKGLGQPWFKGSLKRFENIIRVQTNLDATKMLVFYSDGNVDIYNVYKNKGLSYLTTFNITNTNPKSESKFDNSIITGFPSGTVSSTVNLRVRSQKSLNAEILMAITPMTEVKILEIADRIEIDGIVSNWIKIQLKNGIVGWCFGGYLELNN